MPFLQRLLRGCFHPCRAAVRSHKIRAGASDIGNQYVANSDGRLYAHRAQTVSYTHLDVYKRQAHRHARV